MLELNDVSHVSPNGTRALDHVTLSFVTARRPTHVGVDPCNFYIDRNSDDNVAPVS